MSKKKTETLDDINGKALEAGMSYGKYVGQITCQQLRDGTFPKYDHIETPEERCSRLYGNTSYYNAFGDMDRQGRKKK